MVQGWRDYGVALCLELLGQRFFFAGSKIISLATAPYGRGSARG